MIYKGREIGMRVDWNEGEISIMERLERKADLDEGEMLLINGVQCLSKFVYPSVLNGKFDLGQRATSTQRHGRKSLTL